MIDVHRMKITILFGRNSIKDVDIGIADKKVTLPLYMAMFI